MWLHVAGKRLTRICHSPSFMSLQWKRATSLCSCQRHCWACLSSTRRKLFACWEVRMGATPSTQPCLRSSVMTSPFWRSFLCHFGEMFASWYVDYTCYIYHIIYIYKTGFACLLLTGNHVGFMLCCYQKNLCHVRSSLMSQFTPPPPTANNSGCMVFLVISFIIYKYVFHCYTVKLICYECVCVWCICFVSVCSSFVVSLTSEAPQHHSSAKRQRL